MKKKQRDKYDVSGNIEAQYVDEAEKVLVNKQGITALETLQELEEEALAHAYDTLLSEVRTDTPMGSELLKHIHHRVFGDLFEWAGRWRTVQISKPGAICRLLTIWTKRCRALNGRSWNDVRRILSQTMTRSVR